MQRRFLGIRPLVWLIMIILAVACVLVWGDVIQTERERERTEQRVSRPV